MMRFRVNNRTSFENYDREELLISKKTMRVQIVG